MTARELIQSWNQLTSVIGIEENKDSTFSTQAKRIITNVEIKNEIDYWNTLTIKERKIVGNKELGLDFDKIEEPPKKYDSLTNEEIEHLQRFIEPELERKETKLEQLLQEAETENKDTDQ